MNERAPHPEGDDGKPSEQEAGKSVDSAAEQAKKREAEMEESGKENAALPAHQGSGLRRSF